MSRLLRLGFEQVFEPDKADLIIVNSCGFIESAKKESLDSLIGARSAFPNAKILLAGCLAESYADVFKKDLTEADGIDGYGNLEKSHKAATTDARSALFLLYAENFVQEIQMKLLRK